MPKAEAIKSSYKEKVGEVTKYDKLLKEATVGYCKVKVWGKEEIPALWGSVNDCGVTKMRKADMVGSYKKNRIQQCRMDTMIKITMKWS
jgi:hypothetical protein